jgi:hypothetical protein
MRYIHREIRDMIAPYLRTGVLILEDGAHHAKVRNPRTQDFLPLAGTPSDHRAARNFQAALRRLVDYGEGLIFCKTGHFPQAAL